MRQSFWLKASGNEAMCNRSIDYCKESDQILFMLRKQWILGGRNDKKSLISTNVLGLASAPRTDSEIPPKLGVWLIREVFLNFLYFHRRGKAVSLVMLVLIRLCGSALGSKRTISSITFRRHLKWKLSSNNRVHFTFRFEAASLYGGRNRKRL